MAIYHSKLENGDTSKLEEMDEWVPIFLYPGMPTTDTVSKQSLGPGIYKFRFGNEQVSIGVSSEHWVDKQTLQ